MPVAFRYSSDLLTLGQIQNYLDRSEDYFHFFSQHKIHPHFI